MTWNLTDSTSWLLPDPARTLHACGDVHFDAAQTQNQHDSWFPPGKKEQVRQDCQMLADGGWVPHAFLQIGDCVEATGLVSNGASEDTLYNAWFASMWPTLSASLKLKITGNHDVKAYSGGVDRTAAVAEAALGIANHRDVIDLGFAKLLLICQDSPTTTGVLTSADLTWLDTTLTTYASSECWIAYHFPLTNTVGGPSAGADAQYLTGPADSPYMGATGPNNVDDTEIRAVIATHANATAWISGHTHSALYVPRRLDTSQYGIVMPLTIGSHTVAHINLSAIQYVGQSSIANTRVKPVQSAFITKPNDSGANRIEIRYRDHGLHAPAAVDRARVFTVNL